MTCPPAEQDLSGVLILMALLAGILIGNLTRR